MNPGKYRDTKQMNESAEPVSKAQRAAQKHQRPVCIWLTGLPGAGKSTIAAELERRLQTQGRHTYVLDGDHLRTGLNQEEAYMLLSIIGELRVGTSPRPVLARAALARLFQLLLGPCRKARVQTRQLVLPRELL